MYDYRRLAPEQRIEVVKHRVSRGFPWHRPPHPDYGNGWYFITGACYEHQHHFREPDELTALQRRSEATGLVQVLRPQNSLRATLLGLPALHRHEPGQALSRR